MEVDDDFKLTGTKELGKKIKTKRRFKRILLGKKKSQLAKISLKMIVSPKLGLMAV